jgi:type I restriction enzyme S subunit
MELRPGYRQTEVGVIPEDWEIKPVGQAFEICNNLRLPISQAVREKMTGAFPYYGPTSIQGYINEYRVEGEYALIGEDGDHFLKWRDQPMTLLVRGQFNVNNHAHLVRGTNNLTAWFYYYFSHRDLTHHLTRQGASRYKLTKKTLVEIPCALPPTKAEQEAIAEALSDTDALIESLEQLITKKRQIKQGAMQELLTGKKRLPGFSIGDNCNIVGAGFKPAPTDVPYGWEVKRLGDVLKVRHGKSQHNVVVVGGKYPILASGGEIGRTNEYLYDKPSVLIGRKGTIDVPQFIDTPFWTIDTLFFTEIDSEADAKFIFYKFNTINWRSYNEASGVPSLNSSRIESIEFICPPLPEQTAIATILSDMDAEITSLETRLAKIRQLKQGLMHNLLSGRIRLIE